MRVRVYRYAFLAAALCWMGLLYWLSAQSGLALPSVVRFQDKVIHAAVYGFLSLLLTLSMTPRGTRPVWTTVLLATLVATAYGLSDEWHQSAVPGRTASAADLAADAIGAFLGGTLGRIRR